MDRKSRVEINRALSNTVHVCVSDYGRVQTCQATAKTHWYRKARQSFSEEIALAPLTETLVIALTNLETGRLMTQLVKVKKLWVRVRTSKVPESPPSSSVASI